MDLVTLDSKRYILVNRLENDGDEPHQDWYERFLQIV